MAQVAMKRAEQMKNVKGMVWMVQWSLAGRCDLVEPMGAWVHSNESNHQRRLRTEAGTASDTRLVIDRLLYGLRNACSANKTRALEYQAIWRSVLPHPPNTRTPDHQISPRHLKWTNLLKKWHASKTNDIVCAWNAICSMTKTQKNTYIFDILLATIPLNSAMIRRTRLLDQLIPEYLDYSLLYNYWFELLTGK